MEVPPVLKTEDLGKIFEMAICLAYKTPYVGPFKYDMEAATSLSLRLTSLPELFPACTHTATKGARYDFTSATDATQHLSAKTSKVKAAKVAPQVIGQSSPETFCSLIGIPFTDVPTLKHYIQTHVATILPVMVNYTFDCPNIYYNQPTDRIRYIKLHTDIDWTSYEYEWTCPSDTWGNSSTLKIKTPSGFKSLAEFQFHTKSRTNMAVRWCYDVFLDVFRENLTIRDL
jgi:hypothetical protein